MANLPAPLARSWERAIESGRVPDAHARAMAEALARDHERRAHRLCASQPGFGSHRYRGDPPEAVADQQMADRYRFAAAEGLTLDGEPASVVGVRNSFATVRTRDGRLSGEWAWGAVALIINERGGEFRL